MNYNDEINRLINPGNKEPFMLTYVYGAIGNGILAFVPDWDDKMRNDFIHLLRRNTMEEELLMQRAGVDFKPLLVFGTTLGDVTTRMHQGFAELNDDNPWYLEYIVARYRKFIQAMEKALFGDIEMDWAFCHTPDQVIYYYLGAEAAIEDKKIYLEKKERRKADGDDVH